MTVTSSAIASAAARSIAMLAPFAEALSLRVGFVGHDALVDCAVCLCEPAFHTYVWNCERSLVKNESKRNGASLLVVLLRIEALVMQALVLRAACYRVSSILRRENGCEAGVVELQKLEVWKYQRSLGRRGGSQGAVQVAQGVAEAGVDNSVLQKIAPLSPQMRMRFGETPLC